MWPPQILLPFCYLKLNNKSVDWYKKKGLDHKSISLRFGSIKYCLEEGNISQLRAFVKYKKGSCYNNPVWILMSFDRTLSYMIEARKGKLKTECFD